MGLIEALGYQVPAPNVAQRAMWHLSSSRHSRRITDRKIRIMILSAS